GVDRQRDVPRAVRAVFVGLAAVLRDVFADLLGEAVAELLHMAALLGAAGHAAAAVDAHAFGSVRHLARAPLALAAVTDVLEPGAPPPAVDGHHRPRGPQLAPPALFLDPGIRLAADRPRPGPLHHRALVVLRPARPERVGAHAADDRGQRGEAA